MEELAYRLATPADIASLVALRAAFLAEAQDADPADPVLLDSLSRYFLSALPGGEYISHVAASQEQIIATAGLVFHCHPPSANDLQGKQAYILNVYTLPEWRGRGIASELLQRLIAVARQHSCRTVRLHTYPKARTLYVKAGFTPVDSELRMHLR